MKTLITLLLCSLFLSLTTYSQSNECLAKIKTGKFEYSAGGMVVEVTRTKYKQVETYNDGKSQVTTKIEWINDTEYISTFVKEVNAPGCLKKGDQMKMTILECDNNQYKVRAISENCGSVEIEVNIVTDKLK